jgi:hypothetical protein
VYDECVIDPSVLRAHFDKCDPNYHYYATARSIGAQCGVRRNVVVVAAGLTVEDRD